MSISLRCRTCKADFTVKDSLAGRTTKCPECGIEVRVPEEQESKRDRPKPPPPKNRPSDDDDRPKRRTRSSDEEDREDRPRRSSRDRDDEPKKKSKMPLILILLGGVMFLGCGACGGLGYYFYTKGKALQETLNEKVTASNLDKLKEGMTQREIEAILGPGKQLSRDEFDKMTADNKNLTKQSIAKEHKSYWTAWVDKGLVHRWQNGPSYVLVAYNDPPATGGKLKGLSYEISDSPNSTIHNERIKLPRNPSADDDSVRLGIAVKPQGPGPGPGPGPIVTPPTPKVDPNPYPGSDKSTALRVTAAELIASPKKYERKWLVLSGTAADISLSGLGDGAYLLTQDGKPNEVVHVRCIFGRMTFTQNIVAAKGDEVEVTGRWYRGEPVEMLDCEITNNKRNVLSVSAIELTRDYNTNAATADAKYKGKAIRISGTILEMKPLGVGNGITLRGLNDSKKKLMLKVSAPCLPTWKTRFEAKKTGDRIVIYGEVIIFEDGVVKLDNCWLLSK